MTYPQGEIPGATIPMVEIVYTPLNEGKPELYPLAKPKIRWEDLILLYGKRITVSNTAPGDDETADIYEVPEGKVFFLLSAHLGIQGAGTVKRTGKMWIRYAGESQTTLRAMITVGAAVNGQNFAVMNPCVPILVSYGERISIFNEDPAFTTIGQVVGYEIDTNLFQTLF